MIPQTQSQLARLLGAFCECDQALATLLMEEQAQAAMALPCSPQQTPSPPSLYPGEALFALLGTAREAAPWSVSLVVADQHFPHPLLLLPSRNLLVRARRKA